MNAGVEEFAKMLTTHVRDSTIANCDHELKPSAQSILAKRWRETISEKSSVEQVLEAMIPDIVDDAIFHLLNSIDQGLISLTYHPSNGAPTNLVEEGDGELGGWYMGSDGWRVMFSQQRINNDFANLS